MEATMAWWEWLLISLGGYIICGIIAAALVAYSEGRMYPPEINKFDGTEAALTGCFWPVAIVAFVFVSIEDMLKWFYMRGQTSPERKAQRQAKRDYNKMIEDFAKEHDLNPAKLKKRDNVAA
jgi:hypothetical protein